MAVDINTVAGQIEVLESLGMKISDRSKAEEILGDIGYYRLGFYWFPFEKSYPVKVNRSHVFKEDTSFDTVVRLYYFDYDLRHLLMKYISRIEIHLRTLLVNTMAARCSKYPEWFSNDRIVAASYTQSFDKIYERVKLSPYIRAHHHNHKCRYAPARKTLEYMTFGEIIDLIDAINDVRIRLCIANAFGIRSLKTFDSYLHTVKRIRNRCAHGGVLFDYAASTPLIEKGPVDLSNVYDRSNLNGAINVILFLLGNVSINRQIGLKAELNALLEATKDDMSLFHAICICSGLK